MNTQTATPQRTGQMNIPLDLRGRSYLPHKARVVILDETLVEGELKMKVRYGGREYMVKKGFVLESVPHESPQDS